MTFEAGNLVRVLAPFTPFFPDIYTISEVVITDDGQTVYMIAELGIAFSGQFLELAE